MASHDWISAKGGNIQFPYVQRYCTSSGSPSHQNWKKNICAIEIESSSSNSAFVHHCMHHYEIWTYEDQWLHMIELVQKEGIFNSLLFQRYCTSSWSSSSQNWKKNNPVAVIQPLFITTWAIIKSKYMRMNATLWLI